MLVNFPTDLKVVLIALTITLSDMGATEDFWEGEGKSDDTLKKKKKILGAIVTIGWRGYSKHPGKIKIINWLNTDFVLR